MRWIEPEKQARVELRPALAEYLRLARTTHDFVEAGIATAMRGRSAPPPHSAEVQARLIVKLSHDLRVIELAAKNSYVLQALGLAATVYELSHAVAFIGSNEDRAKKWEEHNSSRHSYPSPAQRRKAVLATLLAMVPDLPDIEASVDRQEQLYEVFCMAKHGNPKALRFFGVAIDGDTVRLYHGPFVTKYVVRQAQFVLLHAAWLVAGATAVFAEPLLEGAPADVRRRYDRLDRTVADQVTRLMKRGQVESDAT